MAINFPDSPSINDTHTVNGRTWVWDGSAWKLSGTINNGISLEVSDTAPSTPIEGDMWYNSANGSTYTYYQSVWVELGNTAAVEAFISDDDGDTLVHVEEGTDDDTIRFDTAGVERLTISSSGHVLPSADVSYDLGSASYRFRDLYLSGSSIDLGGVSITSDGTNLALPPISNISGDFTVDTDTLHVDSTNNRVGIGTTTPAYLLDVNGDVGIDNGQLVLGSWDSGNTDIDGILPGTTFGALVQGQHSGHLTLAIRENDGTDSFSVISGGGNYSADSTFDTVVLHAKADGNVGIGTTSPSERLHVIGDIRISKVDDSYLLFEDTVTPSESFIKHDSADGSLVLAADQNASLADSGISMRVDGITRMRLDSSGNLGIGTTTPGSPLHLFGAGNSVDQIRISSNTGTLSEYGFLGANASTNVMRYGYWTGSGFGNHHFEGNVGIGTASPTSELDITSTSDATINLNGGVDNTNNINFHAHDSGAFWHLSAPRSGDDAFRFYYYNGSAYTESLYQNTSGNIGAKGIYDLTTPATSSLVHSSTSSYQYRLFRSTSRRDAKTDIETITDDNALALLQSRPVWFRSALSHDDPTLSYYGFIAEELAEIDPRLCTWEAGRVLKEGDHASGNERLCTCPDNENLVHTFDHEPECIQVAGVDYGRLTAHLTKIAQLQQSTIESQQTIISDLTERIEALESSP